MSLFLNRKETLLFLRLGVNSTWALSIWWKISVWISENFLWRMDQHQFQNIRKRGQLCEVYPNSQKLHTGNIRSIWRSSCDFGMIEWFALWNSTFYGFSGKNSPRIFPYDLSPFRIFRWMQSALCISISKSVTGFDQNATVSQSTQEFHAAMLSEVIPVFVAVPLPSDILL